ncbi:hypothetical protein V5O48_009897, partial [Marasmius crinis-equi]
MQYTNTGSGTQNNNTGSGTQNNYHGTGNQNINTGPGNMFINTGNGSRGFTTLREAVAGVGASHDAEQQYDRGDCLPGTREKALTTIHEWRTSAEPKNPPICWLLGTAGVGKTAMAINIAKTCAANKSLAASFFCFRSDPNRNNPSLLFLSIAHDFTTSIPWLCAKALLIFNALWGPRITLGALPIIPSRVTSPDTAITTAT